MTIKEHIKLWLNGEFSRKGITEKQAKELAKHDRLYYGYVAEKDEWIFG